MWGEGTPVVPRLVVVALSFVVAFSARPLLNVIEWASAVEAFAVMATPDPPTTLVGTVAGSTVSLSWLPPAGGTPPTSYLVEAALTAGGPVIAALPLTLNAVAVPNVPNGTYFVRVRGVNPEGVSPPSNEIVVTVGSPGCTTVPAPPANLTGNVTAGVVSLAWTAATTGCAPSGFTVRAGSAPNLTNIVQVPVGAATALQASAPPGAYFVTVTAQNAFGSSTPSNEVVVTVGSSCAIPGVPTAFTVGSSGSIASMTWAPPSTGSAPTNYLLEAGAGPGAANLGVLPLAGLSFSTPVPAGTSYLRLKAQNACGVGPATAEQVLTMACIAPGQPAAPGANVSGSTANLSWIAVAGATGYRLSVGTTAGASNILSTFVTGTTRQLTGLTNGTYFMRVAAQNACGSGPTSGEGMFAVSVASTPTCGGIPAPGSAPCGTPTARCNDGTFSCSQNRSGTCSSHGGVSCWICPGRLC